MGSKPIPLGPRHGCAVLLIVAAVKVLFALSSALAGGVLAYIIAADLWGLP